MSTFLSNHLQRKPWYPFIGSGDNPRPNFRVPGNWRATSELQLVGGSIRGQFGAEAAGGGTGGENGGVGLVLQTGLSLSGPTGQLTYRIGI